MWATKEMTWIFPVPSGRRPLPAPGKTLFHSRELDDGREVVAHTNNTGRMRGCLEPKARGCG